MFFYLIKNISEMRYKKCMCIYAVECFYANVYPNRGIKKRTHFIYLISPYGDAILK